MRRICLPTLATVIVIFLFAANSLAGLTRVVPSISTRNETNPDLKHICVWIEVFDYEDRHGPSFVKSITIRAPDGSMFSLHPAKDWLPYDRAYWKTFYASDFKGGAIIGGNYRVTVEPLVGSTISEINYLPGAFLPTPVVTSPAPNATGLGPTPTIRWNPVEGATHYRLLLWNNTWNEPVYFFWERQAWTDLTSYTLLLGDLQPNCTYKFRIEARSNAQKVNQRSRSNWFTFKTGSW
jgi:hypothetical protein